MKETISELELEEAQDKPKGQKVNEFNLSLVKDLETSVEVRLGTISLTIGQLFGLKQNDVIKLDQTLDNQLDIVLKGEVVAKGQLVAVDDHFGIKVTEVRGDS